MVKKNIKKKSESIDKTVKNFISITDGIGMAMALISNEWKVLALNKKAKLYFPDIVINDSTPICAYTCNRDNRKNGVCEDCPVKLTFLDGVNRSKISETRVDENTLNYRLITSPLRNENNNIIAVIELFEDITEKVKAEKDLLYSEKKYKTLVDSMQEGIWVNDKDARTTFVNPKMAEMMGYTVDEMTGKYLFDFLNEEGIDFIKKRLEKRRLGINEKYEVEFYKKNKDKIFLAISGSPVFDNDGNYNGTIAVVVDITDRKAMERKLEESLRTLRSIIDIPLYFFILADKDGRIIDINNTLCEKEGLSREKMINTNCFDYLPVKDAVERKKVLKNILKDKKALRIEGEIYGAWYETNFFPILNESNEVEKVTIVIYNITDKKEIEKKLKENLETLRCLTDIPLYYFLLIDKNGKILDINKTFCEKMGINREKLISTSSFDYLPLRVAEERKKMVQDILKNKKIIRAEEEGFGVWFDTSVIPILDENNEVERIALVINDITEKKEKENRLDKIAKTLRKTLESKAFINKILNSMTEALFVINENGIISLNNYAATFLLENDKIIGNKIDDFLDPEDETGKALIKNIFLNKKIINKEMVLKNGKGDRIYALFSSTIFKDEQNSNSAVCIFNNITDLKKALKIIDENNRRLKQISENINEAFWISNFNRTRIFYLSKPYEKISGREIIYFYNDPKLWIDIVHPDDRDIFYSYIKKLDKNDWNEEYRIIMPDKSIKWISERIFPLKENNKENIDQIIGVTVDITDHKRAHEEALKNREKLMQSSKLASLGNLASGIAHEIAQPLTGLIFGINNIELDLKEKDIDNNFIISRCQDLLNYTDRIKNLIQHIRIFSREQKLSFYSEFNANDCVANVKSLVGTQYSNHGVNLELDLSSDLPLINGNIFRLEQIILDLMSNSKYAVEEKSRKEENKEYKKEIKIKTYLKEKYVFIEINDNGIGISKENLNKVFDPFFTTKPDEISTGLGLSIAYSLIKEMNGEINIFSEENVYTSVQLNFPAI